MKAPIKDASLLVFSGLGLTLGVAYYLDSRPLAPAKSANQSKTLKVAITQSAQEFAPIFEENGFDQDLFELFAYENGYKTQYITTSNTSESLKLLKQGDASVALGIRKTEGTSTLRSSAAYSTVQPLIACRQGISFQELYKKNLLTILISEDRNLSSAAALLKKTYPAALFLTQKNLPLSEALSVMHNKNIDCALTQERIFKIGKLAYPRMKASLILGSPIPIAAYFASGQSNIARRFDLWLKSQSAQVKLESLKEKYFGFFEIFDAYEVEIFEKRIESRLRKYIPYFKEAEKLTGLPWELLAAIAYQESQWNPSAVSFTGVRGLMMLTQSTAKEMGIHDRENPKKSVLGGAAYLKKLISAQPKNIPEHERIYLALASYNVGIGHVKDASTLVKKEESNSWHAIKESLPLLSKKHVYSKLRHGKARGKEPVIYVQRIRKFQKLLSLAFASSEDPLRSESIWAENTKVMNTMDTLDRALN